MLANGGVSGASAGYARGDSCGSCTTCCASSGGGGGGAAAGGTVGSHAIGVADGATVCATGSASFGVTAYIDVGVSGGIGVPIAVMVAVFTVIVILLKHCYCSYYSYIVSTLYQCRDIYGV